MVISTRTHRLGVTEPENRVRGSRREQHTSLLLVAALGRQGVGAIGRLSIPGWGCLGDAVGQDS